jgi:hypothetical protein
MIERWLVPDWRQCWRWFSVHFVFWTGLLMQAALATPVIPPEIKVFIPEPWAHIVVAVWTLLGIAGRVKRQSPPTGVMPNA